MRKLLVLPAALAALLLFATPASAGGWAITSLDALPAPVAGEEVEVGFTILQHGVTPVDQEAVDDGEGISVVVRSPAGDETVFPAQADGAVGHFVAEVEFPEAGTATWWVDQGWFGPYELGEIEVGSPAGAATGTTSSTGGADGSAPLGLRLLLPGVALAGLIVLANDLHRSRMRARAAVAT
jgi:hypothetical protein